MSFIVKNFKRLIVISLLMFVSNHNAYSQKDTSYIYPFLRLGVQGSAQLNMIGLGYQDLSKEGSDFVKYKSFDGNGLFYNTGFSIDWMKNWYSLGFTLLYDNRSTTAYDISKTPNSQFDLQVKYLTFAPHFRFHPSFLYGASLQLSPYFSYLLDSKLSYSPLGNDNFTQKNEAISLMNKIAYGGSATLAWEFYTKRSSSSRYYFSPYIASDVILQQRQPSYSVSQSSLNGIWSTFSLRAGLQFGVEFFDTEEEILIDENQYFVVIPPHNNEIHYRNVKEYYPILNKIYFPENNSQMPAKIFQIKRADSSDLFTLSESDFVQKKSNAKNKDDLKRQLYYHTLTIIGKRLKENPDVDVKIKAYGKTEKLINSNALLIKDYLFRMFLIDRNRISVELYLQEIDEETKHLSFDIAQIAKEEMSFVELEFSDEKILNPIELKYYDQNNPENDVLIKLNDIKGIKKWQFSTLDKNNTVNYGPFTNDVYQFDASAILAKSDSSSLSINAIFNLDSNKIEKSKQSLSIKKFIDTSENMTSQRFYYLIENGKFSNEKEIVNDFIDNHLDKVKNGDLVFVSSYYNDIHSNESSLAKSKKTAKYIKNAIQDELDSEDIDAIVDYKALGNQIFRSHFDNRSPEGRTFNRSVYIEIIPRKVK